MKLIESKEDANVTDGGLELRKVSKFKYLVATLSTKNDW